MNISTQMMNGLVWRRRYQNQSERVV